MSDIIFPAEELLQYSPHALREVLTGEFFLEFPDGVLKTNDRETIVTMPLWDWIRKREIPLKMEYHVSHHLAKKMFHRNLHMDILSRIHWDIYEKYKQVHSPHKGSIFGDYDLLEILSEELYEYSNQQYNLLSTWLFRYVTTASIKDIVALFEVPKIAEILSRARPTEESVLSTTREIKKEFQLSDDPEIRDNRTVRMARAGVIKTDQHVQAVAPTGYIEDVGGEILKYPLMSNYTDGHRDLYSSMAESRKASNAFDATKVELEEAVYQSRRQEILNQIVSTLHRGDCGTIETMLVRMVEKNGLTKPDLELMQGMYYYDPEDGGETLREIKPTDKHLYDRPIRMRTITKCAHPDPNGVCENCFGAMSLSVPKNTNLGQLVTTILYAFIIQLQLSKKHYMANSVVQKLRIVGEDARFLRSGKDGISYYFTKEMKERPFKLVISHDDGKMLTDVMYLNDMERVSISRITEIGSMALILDYGDYTDRVPFIMGTGKRKASFSREMLKYVKEQYWEIDEKNNYVIDMTNWDTDLPFAYVPMKNDSLVDFAMGFKSHIESDASQEEKRDIEIDPDEFLMETYRFLNKNLSINMAQVQVAVYGAMIRSAKDREYGLPKPWSKRGIGVMRRSMLMRSMGANQAFEKHSTTFNSVESYIVRNRYPHPLDCILEPNALKRKKPY